MTRKKYSSYCNIKTAIALVIQTISKKDTSFFGVQVYEWSMGGAKDSTHNQRHGD